MTGVAPVTNASAVALRGRLLWFVDDPSLVPQAEAFRYIDDGLIIIEAGVITQAGAAATLLPGLALAIRLIDHRPHLLCPGFIDTHLHFPQTQVIASYGAQLLDWLNTYVFVEEQKYRDPALAAAAATFLFDELLGAGTTTAAVFCSVHPQSAEAFFSEAARRNTRMIAGKVMMDANAPPALLDTAQRGYDESKALIGRWHGKGRQGYAISPRFAVTSTTAQLAATGALMREHPDCHMQTHLSENLREIETVRALFPDARDYTDVYERYGLLGPRSLFGHCIHLSEREFAALHAARSVAVFCPTSNLFLGSGLFDLAAARRSDRPLRVGVATDIGAGTSYSMLATIAEAYKVCQLRGLALDPFACFYMLTLGNARALDLSHCIGALEPGREADIVVLDANATPAMARRMAAVRGLADELFVLALLGDERCVRQTYVMGQPMKQPAAIG